MLKEFSSREAAGNLSGRDKQVPAVKDCRFTQTAFGTVVHDSSGKWLGCQMAHCGRYIPHFDFGAKPSPIVPYRHLPQTLSGMTADCRSLV